MSNSKSDRPPLKERLCHSLDIQPDVFPHGTLIELRGRNSVTVRGGGSISVYTDTEIRLRDGKGEICVRGKRLSCSAYCKGMTVIDGHIREVCFEEVAE